MRPSYIEPCAQPSPNHHLTRQLEHECLRMDSEQHETEQSAVMIDDEQRTDPSPHPSLVGLAPEIWLEVLSHAPRSIIGTGQWEDMFALSISQVCSSLRELALGTPQLWASVEWQPTGESTMEQAKGFMHLWMLHLERSKQAPLELDLCPMREGGETFGELLEATLAHQSRFQTFNILCNSEQLSPERVYLLSSAPILEDADICVNHCLPRQGEGAGQEEADRGGSIAVDLSGCCALKRLNIEGNSSLNRDTGHLEHLTNSSLIHSFRGQDITCTHLMSFFRSAPSLERMTVNVSVGNIVPPIIPRVSLPRLRFLYLFLGSGDTMAPDSLFGSLHLPSLEKLFLNVNVMGTFGGVWQHATSLQNLRSLKLSYTHNMGPTGQDEIRTLLSFMPLLTSLHISAGWLSSVTMDQLKLQDWPYINLCPELETITLDSDPFRENVKSHFVEVGPLIEMISSRWRSRNGENGPTAGSLKHIQVRFPGIQNIQEMEQIRTFMGEGLVVQLL
ncbi:hypothetical protein SCHPADRAFT_234910 [Schizopora paradoxa]|uniref:F-box domain-containing protein n=1 Tax=Schizopora paradoxa TaxID=27342 RepID=A0A0H2SFW4_9AGAM|nr:hypothetical protein SCHPADRAFT_234910 [Schizopora paradoxa]